MCGRRTRWSRVVDVDVARPGQRTPRRRPPATSGACSNEAVHREPLPGLQVHPDPHREARIGRQHLGRASTAATSGTCPSCHYTLDAWGACGLAVVGGRHRARRWQDAGGRRPTQLDRTKTCLTQRGVRVGGPLDFVAGTATGGAFRRATSATTGSPSPSGQPQERHRHRERLHPLRSCRTSAPGSPTCSAATTTPSPSGTSTRPTATSRSIVGCLR